MLRSNSWCWRETRQGKKRF